MLKPTYCFIRINNFRLVQVIIHLWMIQLSAKIDILIPLNFRLYSWLVIPIISFWIFLIWNGIGIHFIHLKICVMGNFLCRLLHRIYSKLTSMDLIWIPKICKAWLNHIGRYIDYLFYLWILLRGKSDYTLRPVIDD